MIENNMQQPYSLHHFIKKWKYALDNPHEVIFEQNIGTISYYFLERLKTKKIKTTSKINGKYQLKLLHILQNIINSNGTETKILRCIVPSEIRELGKKPNRPSTKLYIKYFKEIDKAYNDRKFVEAVKAQMLEELDSNGDANAINKYIKYLTRSLLHRYSIEYLKDEHTKTFSKSFFDLHSNAIRNKIVSSSRLHDEESILLNYLYDKTHERLSTFLTDQKQEEYLRHLRLSPSWDRDLFFMISHTREMMRDKKITNKIKQLGGNASKTDIYAVLNQPHLRSIFHAITEKACFNFIFNMVFKRPEQYNDFIHDLSELEFCSEFSSLVKSVIYPNNAPSYDNFNRVAASFSYQIFSKAYSKIMQTKISKVRLRTLTTELVRQVSAFFVNELINNDLDVLNKFEINKIITNHVRKTCHSVFEEVLVKMQKVSQESIILQIKQSFTSDLLDYFFDRIDRLPYTCNLSKSQMRYFIASFCQELQKPRNKFRVYFLLGNLNCDQKYFQIGDVTIYDAGTWDLGENTIFNLNDEHDDNSPKRNSARAVVDVMAYDYKSAIYQAKIKVQTSLNSLIYASTAFTKFGGFKSVISTEYIVIFDGKAKKVSRQDHNSLVIDDEYLEISKFHNNLILEPSTKLNNSLIQALEWYNRGYWSETTHQKFILWWIALEQLIRGSLNVKNADSNTLLK